MHRGRGIVEGGRMRAWVWLNGAETRGVGVWQQQGDSIMMS